MKQAAHFLCLMGFMLACSVKSLPAADIEGKKEHFLSQGREISFISYCLDDGQKHRPVMILYGSQGNLEDAQTRGITESYSHVLAARGYHVYAIHYLSFFHGDLPEDNANKVRAIEAKNLSDIEKIISDGIATVRDQNSPANGFIALVGFSFGATLSMDMAATHPDIAAVVDFYGKAYPWIDQLPVRYKAPTIILHGAIDTEAPVSNTEELQKYFEQNKIPHDIHIYPGVGHTFNGNPAAPISQDALKRVLAFLDQYYPVSP